MDMFQALADPTRRRIIEMLADRGRLSASDISDQFQISPQAISQHLKVLREAKLVQVEKRAQQRIYRVNPNTVLELGDWTRRLQEQWSERFEALDKVLEVEKRKAKGV